MRLWPEQQLVETFGAGAARAAQTPDQVFDAVADWIGRERSRPRALMDSFDIEVPAATDDPSDDLAHHRTLAEDPAFTRRVVPTLRPDRYLEPSAASWVQDVDRLAEVSGEDTGTYAGWVAAMEARRTFFRERGAVSTDHSHRD